MIGLLLQENFPPLKFVTSKPLPEEKRVLGRQRLAWAVLLGSFLICALITISVPLIITATLQNRMEALSVHVQSNQGTVGIDDASGGRQAVIAGDAGQFIKENESVLTGNNATALISITPQDSAAVLARMQIYSNSDVRLLEAAKPRFRVSDKLNEMRLRLDNGRIRLTLPEIGERPSVIYIVTPQGQVTLAEPGTYALIVTNEETQVTVQEGQAQVTASDGQETLPLGSRERALIPTGSGPVGPLPPERNLVKNGDFSDGMSYWTEFPWQVERADQPEGQVRILDSGGESRLNIVRQGIGHADVLIRQSVNQDVSELKSLRLLLTFRILGQSLDVCGVEGSECPLFVRINFVNEDGFSRTWQQGFYAVGEVVADQTPDGCIRCDMIQAPHLRVPLQQDFFFDVDLGEEVARQGRIPPSFIESVVLVASGHSFEVEVVDVSLLAEE